MTSCETWKKAAVNDRWELAKKFGLWLKSHGIGRCSLKGTCPVEGCEQRHHPQLHAAVGTPNLNLVAETFHPSQTVVEETPAKGTPTTYLTCGVIEDPSSVQRPGKVAL